MFQSKEKDTSCRTNSLNISARRIFFLTMLLIIAAAFTQTADAQLSMLHASGRNIVNTSGKVVPLQGVNLGGWLVMEPWMTPADSGGLPDTYSIIQELDTRFGVATKQSMIAAYQKSWITSTDLANIKNAGFNVVRVPVWWGIFTPSPTFPMPHGGLMPSLSWTGWSTLLPHRDSTSLSICMGVVGGQSTSDDTGQQNQYWTNGTDQGNTAYMWWQIANHYNGNPTVAGYDLINEPTGAPSNSAVISAYQSLYNSVRSADPNHIIIMEGTRGNWNWSMLPNPSSEGWTNVVYEMHEYQYNATQAVVEQGSTNQVTDFNNHASYNVPGYIGEFNDFGYGAPAWQFSTNAYNAAGLSWTMWSYKSTHGLNPDSWGFYDPSYWPTTPNVSTDSQATIVSDWQQWATPTRFTLNTSLGISGNQNGASVITSSWFNVVNQNSGSCIDDAGWGTANGTTVQQWACGSQQYNQEWQFQSQGNGIYSVANRNANSETWNVTNNGTANGSLIQTLDVRRWNE